MNYSVEHCIFNQRLNVSLIEKVHQFVAQTITPKRTPLYENYTPSRLLIEEHLVFSVLQKDENIEAMSGVFNGGRYPDRVHRVMNRFFHRNTGYISSKKEWRSKAIFDLHTEVILDTSDLIFISFAETRSPRSIHMILNQWNHPHLNWKLEKGLFEVYSHPTNPAYSSWQTVAWCSIRGSDKILPFAKR